MNRSIKIALLSILSCFVFAEINGQELIKITKGRVDFHSNAELEVIRAHSTEISGILDRKKNEFAISIPMISFLGFNSPLQREHFNENYLESHKYPKATFVGKIMGDYNLMEEGSKDLIAKGTLSMHGLSVTREIPVNLVIRHGIVGVRSKFKVPVADFNIKIPKAVKEKIAEVVDVEVYAIFEEK